MTTRSHAQFGPGDLGQHGDPALPDLGRRGVHLRARLAAATSSRTRAVE